MSFKLEPTPPKECCQKCAAKLTHNSKAHDHGHEHSHHHAPLENDGYFKTPSAIAFYIGVVLFVGALLLDKNSPFALFLYLGAYGLIGWEVLLMAYNNIIKGHIFDENFLMGLATIGALCIKEYPEAVAVMFFYRVGEFFQDRAVERSKKSIESLRRLS